MKKRITTIPHIKGRLLFNEPLSFHTTFKIGGPAEFFFKPKDLEDLKNGLHFAAKEGLNISVIGRGSNLLVSDRGVNGIVVSLNQPYFSKIHCHVGGIKYMEIGAGISISALLCFLKNSGLSGLEHLAGVPGTLGGALVMNTQDIGKYVEGIHCISFDGKVRILKRAELSFGYRTFKSKFNPFIILSARFRLKKEEPRLILHKMNEFLSHRKKTQELRLPSAGCIFKNPDGVSAGELIDRAGLKGVRVGDARVSTKHANFIVNLGCASASDVLRLIGIIRKTIMQRFGIMLEPEIKMMSV